MIRIGLIIAIVISTSAYTSTEPYVGGQKVSNTVKGTSDGAITEAIAGVIIGVATSGKDDRKKGALTGASTRGATGGDVGFYIKMQEAALRHQLEITGIRVYPESVNIRNQSLPVLDPVGAALAEFDKTATTVNGYTDSTGSFESSQLLSENRAISVSSYLIQQVVASNRVQSQGVGSRNSIANNEPTYGREQNRRVELHLLSTEQ